MIKKILINLKSKILFFLKNDYYTRSIIKEGNKYYNTLLSKNTNFESRKESLLLSQKKRVVFLYQHADFTTFRYRVYNVVESFKSSENYTFEYFFSNEIGFLIENNHKIDLLILARMPWSDEIEKLVDVLKKNRINIMYDIDDIVFDLDYAKDIIKMDYQSNVSSHIDVLFGYVYRRYLMAIQADSFITTNHFLKNIIEKKFNKKVYIVSNSINSSQLDLSELIEKTIKKKKKKYIKICYFSGSSTHNQDFNLIKEDLIRIMKAHENVKLVIGGFLSLPVEFSELKHKIIYIPFTHYLEQLYNLSTCDINLIPLEINDFTNSKSELKFFEAGLLGIPSIASKTFVYSQIYNINPSSIVLANNNIRDDWYNKLTQLIENESMRKSFGKNAKEYALKTYTEKQIKLQYEIILKENL